MRGDTYGTYERQQAVVERVGALESAGVITDASVEADWQRIRTPERDCRDGAIATYEEFRAWAESNRYSLEPAFERGEADEWLRQFRSLSVDRVEPHLDPVNA